MPDNPQEPSPPKPEVEITVRGQLTDAAIKALAKLLVNHAEKKREEEGEQRGDGTTE